LDSSLGNPVSRALGLKKYKVKSTAFLLAHIFSPSLAKSSVAKPARRRKLQKNKKWQTSCYPDIREDGVRLRGGRIQMKDREKWMEICRQASVEQDPKRLLELTAEIIRLLDEKEGRLVRGPAKAEGDGTPQP
jgi:hypothetical protein